MFVGFEKQMTAGILRAPDARKHTLCYNREWRNITQFPQSKGVSDYLDTTRDQEFQTKQHEAKKIMTNKLIDLLGNAGYKQYFLPWSKDGVAIKTQKVYQDYLAALKEDFVQSLEHLILQGFRELTKIKRTVELDLKRDVLHHAHILQRSLEDINQIDCDLNLPFVEDTLNHVHSFLQNPHLNDKLYVLFGQPGSGKTTLMSIIAANITSWFHEDCTVVYRFLGSSAESSTIHSVVMSITQQICQIYGLSIPSQNKAMVTLFHALSVFRSTIETVSRQFTAVRPLYILLDGINLLHPMDESLHSLWAIKSFPLNVHMLISTSTEVGAIDIVGPLSALVTDQDCCKRIEGLTEDNSNTLIDCFCKTLDIEISERDRKFILASAYNTQNILHLQLLCSQLKVRAFDDSTTIADQQIDKCIRDAFKQIIETLEERYGPLLVKYTLSYLSLSPVGIAEGFLVDLITSDYPVMLEQDFFHNVPPEKTLLLSPRVWAEFKHELVPYVEESFAYGQNLYKWKHQEYCLAVAEKYGVIFPGIQENCVTLDGTEFTLSLHKTIVNFYLNGEKMTSGVDGHKLLVTPQLTNKFNIAKLMRVPLHINILIPIEGVKEKKKYLHFNSKWLQTKMEHASVQAVMHDIYIVSQLVSHFHSESVLEDSVNGLRDFDLLYEFWQLALSALQRDGLFANEVLARLSGLSEKWPSIKKLIQDVSEEIHVKKTPMLYPVYPCLKPPGHVNKYSFHGPTNFIGCIMQGRIGVMFSQKDGVDLWRLDSAELLHRFNVNPEQSVKGVALTPSGDYVLICHYSHLTHTMEVGVWSSHTGKM